MLTAPLLHRRITAQASTLPWSLALRSYTSNGSIGGRSGRTQEQEDTVRQAQVNNGSKVEKAKKQSARKEQRSSPSLYEQLFPDQNGAAQCQLESEIPRVPVDPITHTPVPMRFTETDRSTEASQMRKAMRKQDREIIDTNVLVLRNASKNLLEEDFRRLIPQGKHMEGWTLQQGDILKVIPGRDTATLEQQNFYYLLFSSAMGAFTYQGHATRVHRMVASHTPSSIISPIPPAPGYLVDGIDAHAAIQSFSLVPPNQSLDLRQLKPPLSPLMESIVRHQGYRGIVDRKDRLPFEARLTMEGPQMTSGQLRYLFNSSSKQRGLSWSGDDESIPRIHKWEPPSRGNAPSPLSKKEDATAWLQKETKTPEDQKQYSLVNGDSGDSEIGTESIENEQSELKRRTLPPVYILGFHTERALQTFVHFWHRRPLDWEGVRKDWDIVGGDLPPIANAEVLW